MAAAEGSPEGSPPSLCLTRDDIEQMRSVSYAHAASDWQQQIESLWQQQGGGSIRASHDPLGNLPAEPAPLPSRLEMETEMEASKVEPRDLARRHSAAPCSSRGLDGVAAADSAPNEGSSQLFPPQVDSSDEEEGVGILVRPSRRLTV